ncbi:NAD-dependent epimerase/dehydratase family protein [Jiangella alkaliphila]|uniref:NAD dependent epimerase/dehydratase family protein n=1 Tax=Jiangella alkaliphila TaxID=419479 RepID=A0A1H2JLF3_9ACTN|nr:NAD(P)-dependent oxidoreductase [Jiangella alkaliphila]SDU57193.1 NAD dependent epimerase/dehydratase family protein [Jiangella alkaliphila]
MTAVLVTGAAGKVAQMLRPALTGLDVRAVDAREVTGWDGADTRTGDLADPDFTEGAVEGMDAVVHLAANPRPASSWPELRGPNADAVANLLDAAWRAGVTKVVLASSVHAMGGYVAEGLPAGTLVDPAWPARPCCTYGATKVFAEAYARTVADGGGPAVVCLRLGGVVPRPTDTGNLLGWLSPGDLRLLVRSSLAADVRYGTYFGVSANTRGVFDYANAVDELGYRPESDSETYAGDVTLGDGGLCRWSAERAGV